MKLNKGGKTLVSSILTVSIIIILLFTGIANAVDLSITTNKASYLKTETINFNVGIDIPANERIPIQTLKLQIYDNSLPFLKECVFYPDGTKVSGCDYLTITRTNSGDYGTSEQLYGYGYGANNNYQGTLFGYGYGYGGTGFGFTGILSYTITWDVSSESLTAGNFKAALKVNSVGELNSFEYAKDSSTFTVGECQSGDTKPCGSSNTGECKFGTSTCTDGKWSACIGEKLSAAEVCNNKDDNCNNLVDDSLTAETGTDEGACQKEINTCVSGSWTLTQSEIEPGIEKCDDIDNDCDGNVDEGNVCQPTCTPSTEICDGIDNNCNNLIDENNVCAVIPPTFSCTGATISNAQLCADDDTGLTANTTRSLTSSCTTVKCEYTCSSGFTKSGNECAVIPPTFSCTGATISNAQLCADDNKNLLVDTTRSLANSCTDANKCEYICPSGYTKSGNSCTLQLPPLCTGLIPANSGLCTDDNKGLTADASRNLVSSCSSQKCEYTCDVGYVKSGNNCIIPIPETPNQCNDNLDNDNDGFSDLNDLDCSSLTDNSESGSLQDCKPAATNICGVGGTKTCQSTGVWGTCIGSEPPKMETKQDVLVPLITTIVETLQQAEQTLSKIETNEDETGFELSISTNEQQSGSITVKVYDEMPAEQSFTLPGLTNQKFMVIEPEAQIENDIKQALLKMHYRDPEDLGTTPESELRMYYYNEDLKDWVQEPNSGVNTEENYVWAITNHLSLFTMGKKTEVKPVELFKFYYDFDKDGYGTSRFKELEKSEGYYTARKTNDCDDLNKESYPGATEIFDRKDNDCDGQIDEGFDVSFSSILASFTSTPDKGGIGLNFTLNADSSYDPECKNADLDSNNKINIFDLIELLSLTKQSPVKKGDLNADGKVDAIDIYKLTKLLDTKRCDEKLRYRWDFNNDGAFDTPYLDTPATTHFYTTTGQQRITLEVSKATLTAAAAKTVLIINPSCKQYADITKDDKVDVYDLLEILKILNTEDNKADVNQDGKTDIHDMIKLLNYLSTEECV